MEMVLQLTERYIYLFKLVSLFSSDKKAEVELLDPVAVLCFEELLYCFLCLLHQFRFPPRVHNSSLFFTSSPTLVIFLEYPFWPVQCDISLWFWFAFPDSDIKHFSCAYWPSQVFFGNSFSFFKIPQKKDSFLPQIFTISVHLFFLSLIWELSLFHLKETLYELSASLFWDSGSHY